MQQTQITTDTLSEICTIERFLLYYVYHSYHESSKYNCQHSPYHDSSGYFHPQPSPGQGEQDKSELDCVFVVTNYELSIGAITRVR